MHNISLNLHFKIIKIFQLIFMSLCECIVYIFISDKSPATIIIYYKVVSSKRLEIHNIYVSTCKSRLT